MYSRCVKKKGYKKEGKYLFPPSLLPEASKCLYRASYDDNHGCNLDYSCQGCPQSNASRKVSCYRCIPYTAIRNGHCSSHRSSQGGNQHEENYQGNNPYDHRYKPGYCHSFICHFINAPLLNN